MCGAAPPFFCSLRREIQAMEKTPASGPRDPESVAVQNFRNIMCLTHISRESKVLSDACTEETDSCCNRASLSKCRENTFWHSCCPGRSQGRVVFTQR